MVSNERDARAVHTVRRKQDTVVYFVAVKPRFALFTLATDGDGRR